jgi:L-iditol 2-dehydrogenase
MKKSVFTGIEKIEIIDVPKPVIVNDNDVLIRMTVVGICGSDIHYYSTGRIGSQVVQYPFTVGHEGAGVVEAVGAAVTSVKPGDPIAVNPRWHAGIAASVLPDDHTLARITSFWDAPDKLKAIWPNIW